MTGIIGNKLGFCVQDIHISCNGKDQRLHVTNYFLIIKWSPEDQPYMFIDVLGTGPNKHNILTPVNPRHARTTPERNEQVIWQKFNNGGSRYL